jgi:hypothetical protein
VILHPLFLLAPRSMTTQSLLRAADVSPKPSTPFRQQDPQVQAEPTAFLIRSPDGITSEWLGTRIKDLAASDTRPREDHVPQAAVARPERRWIPMLREKVPECGCLPGQFAGAKAGRAEEVKQVAQRHAL